MGGTTACDRCDQDPVTYLRASGAHLCRQHFFDSLRTRVSRSLRAQAKIPRNSLVAVAVSGGKDSTVTLRLLHAMLADRRDVRLAAITVDEGIPGYRPGGLDIARTTCEDLGVPHHVVSHQELYGITTQEVAEADPAATPCTYCGVWRRSALNRKARELGASLLATGHNLDDNAQSILMNMARGDVAKLARLGPHDTVQPGLIPRIQPLREIPENEVYLYAILAKIPFHEQSCPHFGRAMRNTIREAVFTLEDAHPGTRYALLRSSEQIQKALVPLYPPVELHGCARCGEPTIQGLCEACRRTDEAKNLSGRLSGTSPVPARSSQPSVVDAAGLSGR